MTVGTQGETLRLVDARHRPSSARRSTIEAEGKTHIDHPAADRRLSGRQRAHRRRRWSSPPAASSRSTLANLGRVQPVRGRLERAVITRAGAPLYVDYAHTPDAIAVGDRGAAPARQGPADHRVRRRRRPRRRQARPKWARSRCGMADLVIVTDDNPRSEDPGRDPRARSSPARPARREIGGRREAIAAAIAEAGPDDIILLAGKGHEQGQIVGDRILPFDDVSRRAGVRGMSPLWTSAEIAAATGGTEHGAFEVEWRRLQFARGRAGRPVRRAEGRGDRRPPLRRQGVRGGRGGRLVSEPVDASARARRRHRPQRSTLSAARRGRATRRKIIGVTGSVGKTGTKEALFAALDRAAPGRAHRSVKSYNNHTGVPLSPGADAARRALRRVRNGHEPCRRARRPDPAGAPARRAGHRDRARASRILRQRGGDRRRQGRDLPGAGAGRHRDHPVRQPAPRPADRRGPAAMRRRSGPSGSARAPTSAPPTSSAARNGGSLVTAILRDARVELHDRASRASIGCRTRSRCSARSRRSAAISARPASRWPTWRAQGARRAPPDHRSRAARRC